MKMHLMLITGVAALAAESCLGQTPFVNFFWEASDGGAWTRNQLTTTHQSVQVRLAAEWGTPNGIGFVGTGFDVFIASSPEGDTASNLLRPDPFDFPVGTPAVTRLGNLLKIDDARDFEAPGEGSYWVQVAQAGPLFGGNVDQSNPAIIFYFDLQFAQIPGTRQVNSVHSVRRSSNASIWNVDGSTVSVLAPIYGLDVTYIPTVPSIAIVAAGFVALRRYRRTIGSPQSMF